jgi:thioredoxin-dependent peroxiredoxin
MHFLARRTLLGWLLIGLILTAWHANAADEKKVDLQVGATAPEFEAIDDQGQTWLSSEHMGKKYLVVYFYPGDFTPGCTKQAQLVRDNMNKLKEAGIEVVGVSGDVPETHALFKKAQMLNFTLLADTDGILAKQFGVPLKAGGEVKAKDADGKIVTLKREVTAARWTFIIGRDGKILYKNTQVNPVEDSKQVAAFIENVEKKK